VNNATEELEFPSTELVGNTLKAFGLAAQLTGSIKQHLTNGGVLEALPGPFKGPAWYVKKGGVEGRLAVGAKAPVKITGVEGIGKGYRLEGELGKVKVTLKCNKLSATAPEIIGGEPGKDKLSAIELSGGCEVEGKAECGVIEPIKTEPLRSELYFKKGSKKSLR
jgi:hypothetical protein